MESNKPVQKTVHKETLLPRVCFMTTATITLATSACSIPDILILQLCSGCFLKRFCVVCGGMPISSLSSIQHVVYIDMIVLTQLETSTDQMIHDWALTVYNGQYHLNITWGLTTHLQSSRIMSVSTMRTFRRIRIILSHVISFLTIRMEQCHEWGDPEIKSRQLLFSDFGPITFTLIPCTVGMRMQLMRGEMCAVLRSVEEGQDKNLRNISQLQALWIKATAYLP